MRQGHRVCGRGDHGFGPHLLREFELARGGGIARTSDNVVVRVPKAVRLGGVYFAVQNRDGAAHVLDAVTVAQEGRELTGARVVFTPRGAGQDDG